MRTRDWLMVVSAAGLMTAALASLGAGAARSAPSDAATDANEDPAYVLGFEMPRIDGETESLKKYEGRVVLMVNVASRCGLTPQYASLQKLYETHKDRGLVVLGFPANNFGGQEPGSNEEIAEFCDTRFGVTFPMFAKISVRGEDRHPLYARLASQPEPIGGEPKWNFTKFLVDRSGRVVARFEPGVKPDAAEVVAAVERLLETPAPANGG